MSNPETKACPRCKEEKSLDQFYNNKSTKDGKSLFCIPCQKWYVKNYKQTSNGKLKDKEQQARYREKNREIYSEKSKERARIYRDRNRERCTLAVIKIRRRHAETISDFYLTKMLNVPESCIELKRAQIQILRATKQLVETIKEKQK